jgi:hypothetical protein
LQCNMLLFMYHLWSYFAGLKGESSSLCTADIQHDGFYSDSAKRGNAIVQVALGRIEENYI